MRKPSKEPRPAVRAAVSVACALSIASTGVAPALAEEAGTAEQSASAESSQDEQQATDTGQSTDANTQQDATDGEKTDQPSDSDAQDSANAADGETPAAADPAANAADATEDATAQTEATDIQPTEKSVASVVASDGTVRGYYDMLQSAIDAAQEGDTVKLYADVTTPEQAAGKTFNGTAGIPAGGGELYQIAGGRNALCPVVRSGRDYVTTIDLNGCKLDLPFGDLDNPTDTSTQGRVDLVVRSSLVLKDSAGNGEFKGHIRVVSTDGSTPKLTIESGSYVKDSGSTLIQLESSTSADIKGGSFTAEGKHTSGPSLIYASDAELMVEGGKFFSQSFGTSFPAVSFGSGSKVAFSPAEGSDISFDCSGPFLTSYNSSVRFDGGTYAMRRWYVESQALDFETGQMTTIKEPINCMEISASASDGSNAVVFNGGSFTGGNKALVYTASAEAKSVLVKSELSSSNARKLVNELNEQIKGEDPAQNVAVQSEYGLAINGGTFAGETSSVELYTNDKASNAGKEKPAGSNKYNVYKYYRVPSKITAAVNGGTFKGAFVTGEKGDLKNTAVPGGDVKFSASAGHFSVPVPAAFIADQNEVNFLSDDAGFEGMYELGPKSAARARVTMTDGSEVYFTSREAAQEFVAQHKDEVQSDPSALTWQVTFDLAGGTGTADAQDVAADGASKAARPADPVRAGYVFAGWATADGAAYDFDSPVTADLKLTATWKLDTSALEAAVKSADGLSEKDYTAESWKAFSQALAAAKAELANAQATPESVSAAAKALTDAQAALVKASTPDNPGTPENPDNPGTPENPDNPGTPENPGDNSGSGNAGNTNAGDKTNAQAPAKQVPLTGDASLAADGAAAAGSLIAALGAFLRRRR